MEKVESQDGTIIATDRMGAGSPVVIVGGGPTTRVANSELAGLLAEQFTVFNYDRRGRGDSGDTAPYAVEREDEDLRAVIELAGGSSAVFGNSGGAALALGAAGRGVPVTRLALWEAPFVVDASRPPVPADYAAQLHGLLTLGRKGDALELFFTAAVGLPAEFVGPMRQSPFWAPMLDIAHTLTYDAAILGNFGLPREVLAAVHLPTLVLDGGMTPWMSAAAAAVADALDAGSRQTLAGQQHNVEAAALAPVLSAFFKSPSN